MKRQNLNPGVLQMDLDEEDLEKNKRFSREIGDLGLSEGRYLFERLNCGESFRRQLDTDMTLDKYLSLMTGSESVILQIRDDDLRPEISLLVSNTYHPGDTANNLYLWHFSEFNKDNLLKVKGLYEDIYRIYFPQKELEDFLKD